MALVQLGIVLSELPITGDHERLPSISESLLESLVDDSNGLEVLLIYFHWLIWILTILDL